MNWLIAILEFRLSLDFLTTDQYIWRIFRSICIPYLFGMVFSVHHLGVAQVFCWLCIWIAFQLEEVSMVIILGMQRVSDTRWLRSIPFNLQIFRPLVDVFKCNLKLLGYFILSCVEIQYCHIVSDGLLHLL